MYESLTSRLAGEPMQRTGLCFHSLRAVTPEQIGAILACHPGQQPIHIHIAEQQKRWMTAWPGPASARWSGCTTISRGFALVPDPRHSSDASGTMKIATSGAVASLCLTTEANLGDGIFPGPHI